MSVSVTLVPTHSPSHIAAASAGIGSTCPTPAGRRRAGKRRWRFPARRRASASPCRPRSSPARLRPPASASSRRGRASISSCGCARAKSVGRRLRRVDAERVLGDVAAVRPTPGRVRPAGSRRSLHHRRDRVHHVVVPRPAGEREATGARQLAVEATGRGSARRAAPPTGSTSTGRRSRRRRSRSPPAPAPRRPPSSIAGSVGERPPVADERVLVAVGARRGRRPTDHGARRARAAVLGRAHDDRRRHVDVVVGVHVLRVRQADHPVASATVCGSPRRVLACRDPRRRVVGGDRAEPRPQLADRDAGVPPASTRRRARIAVSNIG